MGFCPYKEMCRHRDFVEMYSPNLRPCDSYCEGCHYYCRWQAEGKVIPEKQPVVLASTPPAAVQLMPGRVHASAVNSFVAFVRTMLPAAFR